MICSSGNRLLPSSPLSKPDIKLDQVSGSTSKMHPEYWSAPRVERYPELPKWVRFGDNRRIVQESGAWDVST